MKIKNYFTSLFKRFDPVQILLLSIILSGALIFISQGSVIAKISDVLKVNFSKTAHIIAYVGLALFILGGAFSIKKKRLTLVDFAVTIVLVAVVINLAYNIFYHSSSKTAFYLASLGGVLAYMLVRCIFYDEVVNHFVVTKKYYSNVFNKYNLIIPVFIGLGLSVCVFTVDKFDLFTTILKTNTARNYGYLGLCVAALVLSLGLGMIVLRKKSVGIIDYLLIVFTVAALYSGTILVLGYSVRKLVLWAIATCSLFAVSIIRSNVVDKVEISTDDPVKKYFSTLFGKYNLLVLCMFGFGMSVILYMLDDTIVFLDGKYDLFISLASVSFLVATFSLYQFIQDFKEKEIFSVDGLLISALIAIFTVGVDLIESFTIFKFTLWCPIVSILAILLIVRIYGFNHEFTKKEEISVIEIPKERIEEVSIPKLDLDEYIKSVEPIKQRTVEPLKQRTIEDIVRDTFIFEPEKKVEVKKKVEPKTIVRTYFNKLKLMSAQSKEFYSAIKNCLLSYGCTDRLANKYEAYRKADFSAKIGVSGKNLRLYLSINPQELDEKIYHHTDCSDLKTYSDTPSLFKISSKLATRKAIELIDQMMTKMAIEKKKKYIEEDFADRIKADGLAILEEFGLSDLLAFEVRDNTEIDLPEEYKSLIETVLVQPMPDNINKTISLGKINDVCDEGDIISLDYLKEKAIIEDEVTSLDISDDGILNKKITVIANSFSDQALKMIIMTGGCPIILKINDAS